MRILVLLCCLAAIWSSPDIGLFLLIVFFVFAFAV